MKVIRVVCALLFLAAVLSPESFGRRIENVLVGTWGGRHMGMEVEPIRASIEFDCGRGSIEQPILLDRQGRFDVRGIYIQEHGGPVFEDEPEDKHPARYIGRVHRKTMSITVILTDTREIVGTFTLFYGQSPHVTKCL